VFVGDNGWLVGLGVEGVVVGEKVWPPEGQEVVVGWLVVVNHEWLPRGHESQPPGVPLAGLNVL